MRWQNDEVDLWCLQWAEQRRQMLGITELLPRDRLGKLRSTLAAVREDGEGASQGTITQNFPEVYRDTSLLVHRAVLKMNRDWRQVVNIHYVLREVTVRIKAKEINISVSLYWRYLEFGKSFINSFVTLSTELEQSDKKSVQTQQISLITA